MEWQRERTAFSLARPNPRTSAISDPVMDKESHHHRRQRRYRLSLARYTICTVLRMKLHVFMCFDDCRLTIPWTMLQIVRFCRCFFF